MTHDAAIFTHPTDPPSATVLCLLKSPWANPSVCDRLKVLWADHSASEIQQILKAEFGIEVTRNSVIGRLHRDKLTIDHKTAVHPLTSVRFAPRRPVTKPRIPNPLGPTFRPKPRREAPELIALRCAEIVPLGLTLLELEHGQCRYPYGDVGVGAGVTFCGHGSLNGLPYCEPHNALTRREPTGARSTFVSRQGA